MSSYTGQSGELMGTPQADRAPPADREKPPGLLCTPPQNKAQGGSSGALSSLSGDASISSTGSSGGSSPSPNSTRRRTESSPCTPVSSPPTSSSAPTTTSPQKKKSTVWQSLKDTFGKKNKGKGKVMTIQDALERDNNLRQLHKECVERGEEVPSNYTDFLRQQNPEAFRYQVDPRLDKVAAAQARVMPSFNNQPFPSDLCAATMRANRPGSTGGVSESTFSSLHTDSLANPQPGTVDFSKPLNFNFDYDNTSDAASDFSNLSAVPSMNTAPKDPRSQLDRLQELDDEYTG